MSATNFSTRNEIFRKLLGSGLTYQIPRFQRDYSWTEEEWEDLWQDIVGTMDPNGEPAHYMGYLVLQTTDDKLFSVIDGQQRLTTLSLIVLAGMRILKKLIVEKNDPESNQQRLNQLRANYIGYLDPVTLVSQSKMTLNRNNDEYYQKYLVTLEDHLPQRGFSSSVHAMRKAYEWFERHVRESVKNSKDSGKAVAHFIENLSDKLFFTVIAVPDDMNAYKVFETLNARGVKLSATDLLKNYLFSVLARGQETHLEMNALEKRWESMMGRLGSESFPDFLRMHWNSRHEFARERELFKVIRGKVNQRDQVFDLLRAMDEDIDTYLAFTQPEGSQWNPRLRDRALDLKMFGVKQPLPMLMSARRILGEGDFETVLDATVVLSFRYNVVGAQNPADQERVYNGVANAIASKKLRTVDSILEALRPIYPTNNSFRAAFSDKVVRTTSTRNNKVVRYILCQIEKQVTQRDFESESPAYSVEHILPQNPSMGWENFGDADLEVFTYRLGNMVMLENVKNRELGNLPFGDKRPVLSTSVFETTREIAEMNEEWTPKSIEARQRAMAKIATSIWKVSQLS